MTLQTRPLLVFIVIAAMLLVSEDGGSLLVRDHAPADAPPVAKPAAAPQQQARRAAREDAAPEQTPAPKKARPTLSDEVKRIQHERLACVAEPVKSADIFASKSWYVPPPPPPPPKPVPPPPPTAPPLPFAFMGSYQEPEGRLILFLTKGDRLYTVSPGDVIDGIYRVEEVAAGQLGLTYLPLNIKQSMTIGDAS